jgi:hypothetical protein
MNNFKRIIMDTSRAEFGFNLNNIIRLVAKLRLALAGKPLRGAFKGLRPLTPVKIIRLTTSLLFFA